MLDSKTSNLQQKLKLLEAQSYLLAILIFLLPFERIGAFSLTHSGHPLIRPSQVAGLLLITIWVVTILLGQQKVRPMKLFWWLGLLLVCLLVSSLSISYGQIWINFISTIFVFALCFVVAQITTREQLPLLTKALFGSALLVGIFGLWQFLGDLAGLSTHLTGLRDAYTKTVFGYPRIQSTALEPLYYANYLLLPLFVGITSLFFNPRFRQQRWLLVALGIISINFLLTMSRGAFVGFIVSLLILVVLSKRTKILKMKAKPIAISLVGLVVVSFSLVGLASLSSHRSFWSGPKTFVSQVTSKLTKTNSFYERLRSQNKAKKYFLEKPIRGLGIGGFGPRNLGYPHPRPILNWPVANNAFWELLAEMGVFGFSFFVLFLGAVFRNAYRAIRAVRQPEHLAWLLGLSVALVAIFIQYQTFTGFFLTHIWVVTGLLIGLVYPSRPKPNPR